MSVLNPLGETYHAQTLSQPTTKQPTNPTLNPLASSQQPQQPGEEPTLSSKSGLWCQNSDSRPPTHPNSPPPAPRSANAKPQLHPWPSSPDKSTDRASSAAPDAAVRQTGLAHIGPEGLQILPLPTPYPLYPPPLIPCHQHKHHIYTHMLMLAHTKFN